MHDFIQNYFALVYPTLRVRSEALQWRTSNSGHCYDCWTHHHTNLVKNVSVIELACFACSVRQIWRWVHCHRFNAADNSTNASDCNGHGTHISSTAVGRSVGVAKEANVVSVKVLNCEGAGDVSTLVAGLNWVAMNFVKPSIIILSLVSLVLSAMTLCNSNASKTIIRQISRQLVQSEMATEARW